jgi:hypothetical protein
MSTTGILASYCAVIILASLAGGWIPILIRLTHTRLQIAISFVAGFMLGIEVLHLLPHAWQQLRSIDRTVIWLLTGFLVMFLHNASSTSTITMCPTKSRLSLKPTPTANTITTTPRWQNSQPAGFLGLARLWV